MTTSGMGRFRQTRITGSQCGRRFEKGKAAYAVAPELCFKFTIDSEYLFLLVLMDVSFFIIIAPRSRLSTGGLFEVAIATGLYNCFKAGYRYFHNDTKSKKKKFEPTR